MSSGRALPQRGRRGTSVANGGGSPAIGSGIAMLAFALLAMEACSVQPRSLPQVSSPVATEPAKPLALRGPTRFYLYDGTGSSVYRFFRMRSGQLFLADGIGIARVVGRRLVREPEFCRGLPYRWRRFFSYGIHEMSGEDEPDWIALDLTCAPPMWSGTPVPFEFSRGAAGWTVVPDDQRRFWRGETHYAVASEFVWHGKSRKLLRPDAPGVGVDGYLSPADLADTSACLGASLIVDDQYRPLSTPKLPRDICVDEARVAHGALFLLGRGERGRLVLERQGDAPARFPVPSSEADCSLLGSSVSLGVEASQRITVRGSYQCADEESSSQHALDLAFDGEGFVAIDGAAGPESGASELPAEGLPAPVPPARFRVHDAKLYEYVGERWQLVSLPRDGAEDPFLGSTMVHEVYELPDGTVWVTAGADGGGCMTSGWWQPRLLYSNVLPPKSSSSPRPSCHSRVIEAENCHYVPALAILAVQPLAAGFTGRQARELAARHHVPASCVVAELRTPENRALAVSPESPWEEATPASCTEFVNEAKLRRWCFDRDDYFERYELEDDPDWKWTVLLDGSKPER